MPSPILTYNAVAVAEAAGIIRAGGIVAVPTETVYGLAADAGSAAAVARIYAAKGRPSFNPLIVHVPDLAAAEALVIFDEDARTLATAFWPGPLTLVLPLRPGAPIAALVTAGLGTLAIRVPAHRAMQALLEATARPLAAPSANRSNGLSPTRAEHVVASLGDAVSLVIDDGACQAGVESTIVAGREVLRPGPITAEEVALLLGPRLGKGGAPDTMAVVGQRTPSRDRDVTGPRPSPGKAEVTAPGQLATHYAPGKPLRLDAMHATSDEWLIGFGKIAGDETLSASGDPIEAAARLFDALHRADTSDRARIAVAPIPTDGIGAAINDRLARAAHR